jgi:hypothetical protein
MRSSKVEKGHHIKNMEIFIYSTFYLLKNTCKFVVLIFSQLHFVSKMVVHHIPNLKFVVC